MSSFKMATLHNIRSNHGARRMVGVTVALCACAVFAGAWQNATSQPSDDLQAGADAAEWPTTSASSDQLASELPSGRLKGFGPPMFARVTADARRAALIAPPLSGQLDRAFVTHGDEVKRGAPLFRLRSVELAVLHTELSRATLAVDKSQRERARLRGSFAQQPFALAQTLAADARVREAERALATVQTRLRTLHLEPNALNSQALIVRAPLDGTVVESLLRPGQAVHARQPLLYIADTSDGVFLEVDVHVPLSQALEVGALARVTLPGTAHTEPLRAHIDAISDVVDRRDDTVRVRIAAKDARFQINDMLQVQLQLHQPEALGRL